MDERSSFGTASKRGRFFRNARARNTHVEATSNHSFAAQAENRHANLLEAFEADRLRQETALRDLQGQYALLERKYAARESRPEDLEKIADLESENNQRAEDLARMKKEMAYFKNELLNREENFNKKFGASPNVGVMNVLPQKKKKAIPRGF